jgi:hypothetical protein
VTGLHTARGRSDAEDMVHGELRTTRDDVLSWSILPGQKARTRESGRMRGLRREFRVRAWSGRGRRTRRRRGRLITSMLFGNLGLTLTGPLPIVKEQLDASTLSAKQKGVFWRLFFDKAIVRTSYYFIFQHILIFILRSTSSVATRVSDAGLRGIYLVSENTMNVNDLTHFTFKECICMTIPCILSLAIPLCAF